MSVKINLEKEFIEKFAKNEKDTGSIEVQIALFTKKITYLTDHLKKHKHDHHTRRGLIAIVGKRKRLLNYLSKKNNEKYKSLIKELNIRG